MCRDVVEVQPISDPFQNYGPVCIVLTRDVEFVEDFITSFRSYCYLA